MASSPTCPCAKARRSSSASRTHPAARLMTIADMSVITAEVKVDETDIVNVQLGQPAEVTIDAIPKQKFKGTVTEIGQKRGAALHRRFHGPDHLQQPGSQGL